jgi:hypothetical protein
MANAQDGQKGEPATKNLRRLRAALRMAQEMGARLGERQILFGSVPRREIRLSNPLGFARPTGRPSLCEESQGRGCDRPALEGKQILARPAGLEPAASRLEVSRSIQMSYGRAPEISLARIASKRNCDSITQ